MIHFGGGLDAILEASNSFGQALPQLGNFLRFKTNIATARMISRCVGCKSPSIIGLLLAVDPEFPLSHELRTNG